MLEIMMEKPLHLAAEKGHVEVTSKMLKKGASVDTVDKYGPTALHSTAILNHVDLCELKG
jgi:ankyrin repeat protein